MPHAITQYLKEKWAKLTENAMDRGKRKAAKFLIGLDQDETIAKKLGMSLEDVKKLHQVSRHKS